MLVVGVADTHTAVWHLFDDARLSATAGRFIDEAAAAGAHGISPEEAEQAIESVIVISPTNRNHEERVVCIAHPRRRALQSFIRNAVGRFAW